ncbi:MAG: HEAT repeat domain-containing protein [bacterium]|nr:HEAT repeat domain-containing protein [bacterium]
MSENDVPYSSGCFAAGLFLLAHFVLLIVFIKLHIGLFFPLFCLLEFIGRIIVTLLVGRQISWLKEQAEKENIEGLKSVAKGMNFSFSPKRDLELFGRLRHYSHLLSQGDSWKIANVMQGKIHDLDVTIMDYEQYASSRGLFIPGFGRWQEDRAGITAKTVLLFRLHTLTTGTITPGTGDHAVIIFRSQTLRLPSFTLHPEVEYRKIDTLRKVDNTLGYQDIDCSSHPTFSRQYVLQGSDEEAIRGLFNKNILSYYEQHVGMYTEGVGEQLLLYKPSERLSPEKIPSFMEQGLQVFELFRAAHQEWTEVVQRLEERKKHPGSLAPLIADLTNEDWDKQFIARHTLTALGGEVIEPLMATLAQDSNASIRERAVWVLKRVVEDTTTRLARNAPHLVCSRCLVHFRAHRVNLSWWHKTFTYYGCRACRQSREFFDWPGEIVAVLDREMNAEQVQTEGVLRVNWLQRRSLFDFDRVEIVKSNDEQVERFAVQAGNDTDSVRRPRYKEMPCQVASNCRLSENTLRILKNTFGSVSNVGT